MSLACSKESGILKRSSKVLADKPKMILVVMVLVALVSDLQRCFS